MLKVRSEVASEREKERVREAMWRVCSYVSLRDALCCCAVPGAVLFIAFKSTPLVVSMRDQSGHAVYVCILVWDASKEIWQYAKSWK